MDADGNLWARLPSGQWVSVDLGGSPVWEGLVEDCGPLTLWEPPTDKRRTFTLAE